jgi:hypothetical protein
MTFRPVANLSSEARSIVKGLLRPLWTPVRHRLEAKVAARTAPLVSRAENAEARIATLQAQVEALAAEVKGIRYSTFSPDPSYEQIDPSTPFLEYSNCQATDFYHPRFIQLFKLIDQRPRLHRKHWEWIFVLHKLLESGVVQPGAKGLVFGVGREPLPAVFASLGADITATDAPLDLATTSSWTTTDQHSAALEGLMWPAIVSEDKMRAHVRHAYCDMNAIRPEFFGYDFNWSCCCFEHLGSLRAGMDFVVNAVENTLKVGGVAVHTTEFNFSSNNATVETGETVLYRRRDMEELVQRLRDRGHQVEDFRIGPLAHALDFHVDVPPYTGDVHLKLRLAGYACTSVGIVVRRGR